MAWARNAGVLKCNNSMEMFLLLVPWYRVVLCDQTGFIAYQNCSNPPYFKIQVLLVKFSSRHK
jgi:hypothetical protein